VFALTRVILPVVLVLGCVLLIVIHGIRGLIVVCALVLISAVVRSRPFRLTESFLIRLTGSRRNAWTIVAITAIVAAIVVNVYQLAH
jgi:hypothetical protein